MMNTIHFTKMHGLGNDYIYIDADRFPIEDPAAFSIKWSRPHTGIGSDGLILISRSDVADFRMRIFNADGTEAMMCGNGSRCVGKYVYDKGLTDKTVIRLDTLAGIKVITLHLSDGEVTSATVDMGKPALACEASVPCDSVAGSERPVLGGNVAEQFVPTKAASLPLEGTFVSMGNPHYVVFLDHIPSDEEVTSLGREMEFAEAFPQRCNIEFAYPDPDDVENWRYFQKNPPHGGCRPPRPVRIRMRVWERGSGITQACGTGACATAVAAAVNGFAGRKSIIKMDGGELTIRWDRDDNHIYMTGPAETAFEGFITLG